MKDVKLGRKPSLPSAVEKKLVGYCVEMDCRFFCLTKRDVCTLVFQVADANNLKTPFNFTIKTAGKKSFYNFMARNPKVSLRTPQATSADSVLGFTRANVGHLF